MTFIGGGDQQGGHPQHAQNLHPVSKETILDAWRGSMRDQWPGRYPGRALIHVFNNPSAMEGYLSGGIYLKNWNSLHPISTYKSKFCHFR